MQDRPTAVELLEAVREFLERDLMANLDGRLQFHTRVSVNVLATVIRELELGADHDASQRARLVAILGDTDATTDVLERQLAAALRNGTLDATQYAAADAHVRATVHEKLLVANPKYLEPDT